MSKLIVFVCNGNIHRSVIASACLTKIIKEMGLNTKYSVASYGLQGTLDTKPPLHKKLKDYPKEWAAVAPILDKFDIDISRHSFQKITPAIVKKAAVIIAMDNKTHSIHPNALLKQFPKVKNKIHNFSEVTLDHKDISDPFGKSNKKLHYLIIKNIHLALHENIKIILSWIK